MNKKLIRFRGFENNQKFYNEFYNEFYDIRINIKNSKKLQVLISKYKSNTDLGFISEFSKNFEISDDFLNSIFLYENINKCKRIIFNRILEIIGINKWFSTVIFLRES